MLKSCNHIYDCDVSNNSFSDTKLDETEEEVNDGGSTKEASGIEAVFRQQQDQYHLQEQSSGSG